jgi:hypothetical protein
MSLWDGSIWRSALLILYPGSSRILAMSSAVTAHWNCKQMNTNTKAVGQVRISRLSIHGGRFWPNGGHRQRTWPTKDCPRGRTSFICCIVPSLASATAPSCYLADQIRRAQGDGRLQLAPLTCSYWHCDCAKQSPGSHPPYVGSKDGGWSFASSPFAPLAVAVL